MARALLAGTKTQTRREVTGNALNWLRPRFVSLPLDRCPYGQPGDRLWVRETWAAPHSCDHLKPSEVGPEWRRIHYAATESLGWLIKRPSIFMPRWASRITLEITGVRVERLQAISEADAKAEGSSLVSGSYSHRGWFRELWGEINGPGSWEVNPWVWVVEFRRLEVPR